MIGIKVPLKARREKSIKFPLQLTQTNIHFQCSMDIWSTFVARGREWGIDWHTWKMLAP